MPEHQTADLLVIGAGRTGPTAGARAVHNGLSVTVVEIRTDAGGSARYAGCARTAPSREVAQPVLRHPIPSGIRFEDPSDLVDLSLYVEGAVAVDRFAVAGERGGRVGFAEDLERHEPRS